MCSDFEYKKNDICFCLRSLIYLFGSGGAFILIEQHTSCLWLTKANINFSCSWNLVMFNQKSVIWKHVVCRRYTIVH